MRTVRLLPPERIQKREHARAQAKRTEVRRGRPRNPDYSLMGTSDLRAEVRTKKQFCTRGRTEFIQRWPALTRAAKERIDGKGSILDQELPRRTRLGIRNSHPTTEEAKAKVKSAWIRKQFGKLDKTNATKFSAGLEERAVIVLHMIVEEGKNAKTISDEQHIPIIEIAKIQEELLIRLRMFLIPSEREVEGLLEKIGAQSRTEVSRKSHWVHSLAKAHGLLDQMYPRKNVKMIRDAFEILAKADKLKEALEETNGLDRLLIELVEIPKHPITIARLARRLGVKAGMLRARESRLARIFSHKERVAMKEMKRAKRSSDSEEAQAHLVRNP